MALTLEKNALVWGITGNLGGGKSLTAVYFMVNAISSGYFVVTNITLDIDLISRIYGSWCHDLYLHVDLDSPDIDPYQFPCGDPRGSGGRRRVLCVFDECAEWFDQYANVKDPKIKRLWSWLRHSSKRSQDVFLIVQRPDYLNKVLRILVARWLNVNDLAVWRVPLLRAKLPLMSGFVVAAPFDRTGKRVGHSYFIRKSSWGRFYDTAECLNSDGSRFNSVYVVDRNVKPSRLPWVLWLFSLFVLIACSIGCTEDFRHRGTACRAPYGENPRCSWHCAHTGTKLGVQGDTFMEKWCSSAEKAERQDSVLQVRRDWCKQG